MYFLSPQGVLQQEELFVAVEMLSAVALINQALEAGHMQEFSFSLVSPSAGLSEVEPTLLHRYTHTHTHTHTHTVLHWYTQTPYSLKRMKVW